MHNSQQFRIGWGSADITPEHPVQLAGQFHARVSEGIMDPIGVTALALSAGDGSATATAVLASCDLVAIPTSLRDAVRERLPAAVPELALDSVILNATHTHTAPEVRAAADYEALGGISSAGMCIDLPAMAPADYVAFAATRIVQAVAAANWWNGRSPPSGIS